MHTEGQGQSAPRRVKCRLCKSYLDASEDDDFALELCRSCKGHPDAQKLLPAGAPRQGPDTPKSAAVASLPFRREFTAADKALIKRLSGLMSAQQILDVLNGRLASDMGPDATPFTMGQLKEALNAAATPVAKAGDWASLRRLLGRAARDGTLDAISEQVIDDFAVVYSLNHRQVMVLKDIVLKAKED